MNNLPKVVAQQRRGWASNLRLLDRKSDALPLSHRATRATVINSALSNHFATGRKYFINLLPSVPIVGNPGEAVNILSVEPRSCNAETVPPAE